MPQEHQHNPQEGSKSRSITGPSVSVRCRWHEAHVGNSQLLHRLCGTTGLTFRDQLWALQGINFGPAGAHSFLVIKIAKIIQSLQNHI